MILFNDYSRIAFLVIAGFMAALEYFEITGNGGWKKILGVLLVLASCFIFLASELPSANIAVILSLLFFGYLFILKKSNVTTLHKKGALLISIFYMGMSTGLHLELVMKHQINFLLIMIIFIWVADSGAYFVGKTIGKRKFAPSISPKKTWEGFLGGGMLTLLVAYVVGSFYQDEFGMQFWLLFGFVVWFFGAFGDLVESQIKRSFDIKDSGTLLPGHGGFLDRFDGFIYILPFTALLIHYSSILS